MDFCGSSCSCQSCCRCSILLVLASTPGCCVAASLFLAVSTGPLFFLQSQLSEALALVAKHDFPAKWQKLLPEVPRAAIAPKHVLQRFVACALSKLCRAGRLSAGRVSNRGVNEHTVENLSEY